MILNNNQSKKNKKTILAPKIWMGMNFIGWLKVLKEGHFRVGLCCIHAFILITFSSIYNSLLSVIEKLIFSKKINSTKIDQHPIFIIGHWRSGTTLLHELLSLDKQYSYPNTYQCFFPSHFLITEFFNRKIIDFMMKKRPMDEMPMGSKRPQEDEFALCNLGSVSPYRGVVFPEEIESCAKYLRIVELPKKIQQEWQDNLVWFFKKLTYQTRKQLIIKSPTHSFRISLLIKIFPNAKFIHIKRDPYTIYKSTQHLWMTLLDKQGLQRTNTEKVNRHVINTFISLHQAISDDKKLLTNSNYHELSYEDLVSNPVTTLDKLYKSLSLGNFSHVLEDIEKYQESNKDYKTNKYELDPAEIDIINTAWADWINQQGYKLRKGYI